MTDPLALDQQVCFALYTASRAMTAAYRPKLGELGVTYPQYLVMLALWERDDRSVGDLSGALALDSGTLSPLLKRLAADGLVERHRASDDERRVMIRLTAKGRDLRSEACVIPARMFEATGLEPEELTALRTTLHRLSRALVAHARSEEN